MPTTGLDAEVILAISTLLTVLFGAFTTRNTMVIKTMQDLINAQARKLTELQDEYAELKAENIALRAELAKLREENAELRRQLANTKPRPGW